MAVVKLPRISNVTDIDALGVESGVGVRFVDRPEDLLTADLAILPGTRATVSDLAWLRERGLADALAARAADGRPVLGICGGYQMLAQTITDTVESGAGRVPGLGLLPTTVTFRREKILGRPSGTAYGQPVRGYEIHHGVTEADGGEPFLDGCRVGAVWGTTWHGILENDAFRQAFLTDVATVAGTEYVPSPGASFAEARERRLEVLGDLVADHLDGPAVRALIEGGPVPGLPFVPPGPP